MPPLPTDGAGVCVGGTGGYMYISPSYICRGSEGGSGDAAAHRTQLTRQVAEWELLPALHLPLPLLPLLLLLPYPNPYPNFNPNLSPKPILALT